MGQNKQVRLFGSLLFNRLEFIIKTKRQQRIFNFLLTHTYTHHLLTLSTKNHTKVKDNQLSIEYQIQQNISTPITFFIIITNQHPHHRNTQTEKQHKMQATQSSQMSQKLQLYNEFVNNLLEIVEQKESSKHNKNKDYLKIDINMRDLFDLLIYLEKKTPQVLTTMVEMNLIPRLIHILPIKQYSENIKPFILLIANCRPNGVIIRHLLQQGSVDKIMSKYLQSMKYKGQTMISHEQEGEGGVEYLGSLLKACCGHVNQETWRWFCGWRGDIRSEQVQANDKVSEKNEIRKEMSVNSEYDELCRKMEETSLTTQNDELLDPFGILTHIEPQQQLIKLQSPPQKFSQSQCLLLKICTRFHNCPEELTRTTIINIVMRLLNQPYTPQMIRDPLTFKYHTYIHEWSYNMCCGLRNELKNFSQRLLVTAPQQMDMLFQEINDKIILWEDLTHTSTKDIYQQNFIQLVVDSLLIGALNTSSLPMFNIKFTFFILAKMMKIFCNLQLLQKIGQLLLSKQKIHYSQGWITTAVLKGFDLSKLLDDKYFRIDIKDREEMEVNKFQGVNQFFMSMLKSKDESFLMLGANLLCELVSHIRKDQKLQKKLAYSINLEANSPILTKLTSTLIQQLRHDHHPISVLRRILQTIIHLHPSSKFNEQNSNQFVFFYQQFLTQTLDIVQKGKKFWGYLVETFQYDMKILEAQSLKAKGWRDQELLGNGEWIGSGHQNFFVQKESNNYNSSKPSSLQQIAPPSRPFYTIIPETPKQTLRYKIIKTFLLLKFNELMIQNKQTQNLLTKYVQKLRIWQEKQPKSGDKLPYPLKQKFHQCKLVEEKTEIPCVVIQDDVNLIIGFVEANCVKVIVNVKLKHVEPEIYTKKDKTYIRLSFNRFDFVQENVVHRSILLLRGFSTGIQYFAVKKENFKQKEINSIRKGLKKTIQNLPQISLL